MPAAAPSGTLVWMLLRLLAMAVLFGGVAVGCSGPTYVTLDAGSSDAATLPNGALALVSPASVTLRNAERATIEVRYTDAAGIPRSGIAITAAIDGAAQDSTLSALSATTDETGLAHVDVVAGSEVSSFRVRLSAREAPAAVYVDVGVGTSFGNLTVHAPYTGMRAVTHRVIDLVPGTTCGQLTSMPPTSGGRTVSSSTDDVVLRGLPTTLTYALLVRAQGELATEAVGCVSGVMAVRDQTTVVDVVLLDVPLGVDGAYDVDFAITSGGAVGEPLVAWATSLRDASAARGGDATLLLDAVEAELVRGGGTTDAALLHALRGTEAIDLALGARLDTDGTAPSSVLAALLDRAAVALDAPTAHLGVTLGLAGGGLVTTDRFDCDDGEGHTLTLVQLAPMARVLRFDADPAGQSITIASAPLDAPIGTLAMAWMEAAAVAGGAESLAGLLEEACVSLDGFAGDATGTVALVSCEASCRRAACLAVLEDLSGGLTRRATELDLTIAGAELHGELAAHDDDGDARVDRLEGMLAGDWLDATATPVGTADATVHGARSGSVP